MKPLKQPSLETAVVHAGEDPSRQNGAVVAPIYQSATYLSGNEQTYGDVRYVRLNNTPSHISLHEKLAAVEHAEAALATASGMAAITSTLLSVLKVGDHLLAQSNLYGGTHTFLTQDFKDLGLSYDFIDLNEPETWKGALRAGTKAVYVESITNPLVRVGELEAIAKFAREHDLISIIDNTFASPVNFNPIDAGFDLVVHSATKYLNGHSDVAAGCIMGSKAWIQKIRGKVNHFGGTLDPHACFLLQRGIKTLALRVARQNETAIYLARFLEALPRVSKVFYPGLESHPDHSRAKRFFRGFGGMLSFELRADERETEHFLSALKLAQHAPSLGGVETLVIRPAKSSHLGLTPRERQSLGISDTLIRLSVGIENKDDLCEDIASAAGIKLPA